MWFRRRRFAPLQWSERANRKTRRTRRSALTNAGSAEKGKLSIIFKKPEKKCTQLRPNKGEEKVNAPFAATSDKECRPCFLRRCMDVKSKKTITLAASGKHKQFFAAAPRRPVPIWQSGVQTYPTCQQKKICLSFGHQKFREKGLLNWKWDIFAQIMRKKPKNYILSLFAAFLFLLETFAENSSSPSILYSGTPIAQQCFAYKTPENVFAVS